MAELKNRQKQKKEKQPKQPRGKMGGSGKGKNAVKGTGKIIWTIVFYLFMGLIAYSFLTGYLNQRKTGESILQYYENTARGIGNFLNGQAEKPLDGTGLHMTKDGIYLDGHEGTEDNPIEKPEPKNGAGDSKLPIIE